MCGHYPCIKAFVRFANNLDSQDSGAMIYPGAMIYSRVGMLKCFSKFFHPKFKNVYEALTGAQMHPLPRSKYALAV